MNPEDPDLAIRLAAFEHLRKLVAVHGPVAPWDAIATGFTYMGHQVALANRARGIHRPRQMVAGALSMKTTVPREGRTARYDDQIASEAGHFVYKFQGDDPRAWDNRWLHTAYRLQAPLIYFYGIDPGLYRPLWPVFIVGWDPDHLQCLVAVDEAASAVEEEDEQVAVLRRRYATVQAKQRLHQDGFRALVLRAYETRCAVCRLPRAELLDAAHILPDRDVRGRPEVPNGLSLCRLHHAAYDRDLMGIRPDHEIEIAPRLMKEHDGPVLEQALKGFHGRSIQVPRKRELWPRSEYLEERFEAFRMAG